MSPEQQDFLDLIELLLDRVSKDRIYRHIRETIGQHVLFMEDTVTHVLLIADGETVVDVERSIGGPVFWAWDGKAAAELTPILKQHYLLDILAGI